VPTKEEIAASLRKMLGVNIKFEKLSKDELYELVRAIEKLLSKIQEEAEEGGEAGPLGLGVIPAIREQLFKILPEIRKEVRRTIEEAVFGAISEGKRSSRKAQKG